MEKNIVNQEQSDGDHKSRIDLYLKLSKNSQGELAFENNTQKKRVVGVKQAVSFDFL